MIRYYTTNCALDFFNAIFWDAIFTNWMTTIIVKGIGSIKKCFSLLEPHCSSSNVSLLNIFLKFYFKNYFCWFYFIHKPCLRNYHLIMDINVLRSLNSCVRRYSFWMKFLKSREIQTSVRLLLNSELFFKITNPRPF